MSADVAAIPARALPPDGGERTWITGDTLRILATAADTDGRSTLIEVQSPPGGGPPPHLHEHEDEHFYILDGEFELLIGRDLVRALPGTYAFVPRGTVHRFRSAGPGVSRMLIAFTPGGLEDFFREAGTPATGDGPPPPVDEAEIARTGVAAARHGLRVVTWDE